MKKIIALSVITSGLLTAAGYKIPEQSLNSMALGAAYVAHTTGADTNYYNPAAMSFMVDKQYVEGGVTLAHLPSNEYTLMDPYSGESEEENIWIPNAHYVANAIGNFRWGVSLTAPGGLTKRWNTPFQKLYAEEFTLKIVELNPSASYKVTDNFSIGGGVRIIYSEGVVNSDGADAGAPLKREMEGDTIEFGYNLAMLYKPTNDINLAITYRSNVDLKESGQANLYFGGVGKQYDADVTVPLPAALNIAISKTWNNTFTLEAVYERTYWSKYKTLDFNYGSPIANPILDGAFNAPIDKEWKDTNTFRFGATVVLDKITLMMGLAIDETPVPDKTIGFELPDSDATIFSMGFRYQQTDALSWGAAFLYDGKDARALAPGIAENMVLSNGGGFTGGGAYLTTVGVAYEF
ncbi:long-chain fatty acid transporter [Sulfurovum lithotrophicum]|uniref:Long-chain fatty acid transporter n=1 Tax=Sulfurovum lithotrophicum TaxID=206403 RepID=A0A7U4LZI3_9BACT|nr:outer membrane protein transport protein [Sulfurovum lithotrophicum]AKF24034.1 long-chain fatty acid transporter [Sulfurovum lithotrophicum]